MARLAMCAASINDGTDWLGCHALDDRHLLLQRFRTRGGEGEGVPVGMLTLAEEGRDLAEGREASWRGRTQEAQLVGEVLNFDLGRRETGLDVNNVEVEEQADHHIR